MPAEVILENEVIVPIDQPSRNHRRGIIRTEQKTGSLTTLLVSHENGSAMGEFYCEVDGFYVWDPGFDHRSRGGFISQEILLALGEKLKELNAPWQRDIDEYFSSQEECTSSERRDTITSSDEPGEPS